MALSLERRPSVQLQAPSKKSAFAEIFPFFAMVIGIPFVVWYFDPARKFR